MMNTGKKFNLVTVIITICIAIACAIGLIACSEKYSDANSLVAGIDNNVEASADTNIAARVYLNGSYQYSEHLSVEVAFQSFANSAATVGKIELQKDCELTSNTALIKLAASKEVTLDFNGYEITTKATSISATAEALFVLKDGANLNFVDSYPSRTHAYYVDEKITFVSGGTISGGKRGVKVGSGCTFTMSGGNIVLNNSGDDKAAGVLVEDGGTFNMDGGSIMYNTTSSGKGAGVYVSESGTFSVSGSPKVLDNKVGSDVSNVYFAKQNNNINVSGELKSGSNICVSNVGVITTGYKAANGNDDPNKYFKSDDASKTVYLTNDGEVEIGDAVASVSCNGITDYFKVFNSAWDEALSKSAQREIPTLKLLADITATNSLVVDCGDGTSGTLIFDFNGRTLTLGYNINIQVKSGSLSLVSLAQNGGKITGGRSTGSGSAVYVSGGSVLLNGITISGNTSSYAGAVYLTDGSMNMTGGEISENSGRYGGGVYLNGGSFTMNYGTITDNTATGTADEDGGGGVYVSSGSFTMGGGEIKNNTAYKHGGGVYVNTGASFNINWGSISGNTAGSDSYGNGGGVYVGGGRVHLSGSGGITGNKVSK